MTVEIQTNEQSTQTPLEWEPLWKAMQVKPYPWVQTTEKMYWNMLECVPPRAMNDEGFLVGEAECETGDGQSVYACFVKHGNLVKARYTTLNEFYARTYPPL